MTIKTILAPLAGAPRDQLTLAGAFTVAGQFESHVDAMFAKLPAAAAVPMVGEGVSGAMIEQLVTAAEQEWERRETDARTAFEAAVGAFDIALHEEPPGPTAATAAWRQQIGREDEIVVRAGNLSDLLVLGQSRGEEEDVQFTLTLEAALFRGSRPVLLVPKAPAGRRVGGVIAIAWNGSAEGARAVADAMPFLHQADAVHVLTAESGKTDASVADSLADYLAWHGVLAAARKVSPGGDGVGAALLTAAGDLGADLIVMGGYTHSRLRELILGGVTRHMLANAEMPVLLSH